MQIYHALFPLIKKNPDEINSHPQKASVCQKKKNKLDCVAVMYKSIVMGRDELTSHLYSMIDNKIAGVQYPVTLKKVCIFRSQWKS
jgi:hypothetical protein